MNAQPRTSRNEVTLTGNDRLKRSFGSILWGAMIFATVVHFAVFQFWPELQAADISARSTEVTALTLPPDPVIPPPPNAIPRPAKPEIASGPVDVDLTIPKTDFGSVDVSELPAPPKEPKADRSDGPKFTPYTVGPSILNRDEVVRAMQRSYPPLLRDAGIGGTVTLYLYIDVNGVVRDHRIAVSSGHPRLDSAAIEVADVYRFTPALNRDQKTAVWVQFPITFSVR